MRLPWGCVLPPVGVSLWQEPHTAMVRPYVHPVDQEALAVFADWMESHGTDFALTQSRERGRWELWRTDGQRHSWALTAFSSARVVCGLHVFRDRPERWIWTWGHRHPGSSSLWRPGCLDTLKATDVANERGQ